MASLAQNLAQIRRRAKGEVRRIEAGISAAQASGNKNEEAKLTWRREFIQEGLQASYLKGKTGADRLDAVQAAYALRGQMLGGRTVHKSQEAYRRRDALFKSQLELERSGTGSATYAGVLAKGRGEQIFYAATQDIWHDVSPMGRDKAIMAYLGVDTLEEAYEIVLGQNVDAFREALNMGEWAAESGETITSDFWIGLVHYI